MDFCPHCTPFGPTPKSDLELFQEIESQLAGMQMWAESPKGKAQIKKVIQRLTVAGYKPAEPAG